MVRTTAVAPALVVCLVMSLHAAETGSQNPPGGQESAAASQTPVEPANAQPAPPADTRRQRPSRR